MKQHFSDYGILYGALVAIALSVWIGVYSQERNRREHGKIEKFGNCEFIKLYTGKDRVYQYIHNPKCPNCAGNK